MKQPTFRLALILAASLAGPRVAIGADWRMIIASDVAVVMIDAQTLKRDAAMRAFRTVLYTPRADENGAIGFIGNTRLDCANGLSETTDLLDVRTDGSTRPSKEEPAGLVKVQPQSFGEAIYERICAVEGPDSWRGGVAMAVAPDVAARSVFALLKLGLSSDQASELATFEYQDADAMKIALDNAKVATPELRAIRKVLSAQLVAKPKPPPPIVPLRAAVASGRVGRYSYSEHELVSGIWLKADGTFEYGLTVGSLDETAKGRWTASGNRIRLVNVPRPVAPAITAGPAKFEPDAALSLRVTTPNGKGVAGVDLVVGFDSGDPAEGYTQTNGWHLPSDETRLPRWVEFSMSSYNLKSPRFSIDRGIANVLNFVLTPNDIGVVDFTGMRVEADEQGIVIHRGGAATRFSKDD